MISQNHMKKEIKLFYTKDWSLGSARDKQDYEMLDTGEGEKLERFGKYTFVRPYEDAVWAKTLSKKEWSNIDGKFWSSKTGAKSGWKSRLVMARAIIFKRRDAAMLNN